MLFIYTCCFIDGVFNMLMRVFNWLLMRLVVVFCVGRWRGRRWGGQLARLIPQSALKLVLAAVLIKLIICAAQDPLTLTPWQLGPSDATRPPSPRTLLPQCLRSLAPSLTRLLPCPPVSLSLSRLQSLPGQLPLSPASPPPCHTPPTSTPPFTGLHPLPLPQHTHLTY